MNFFNSVLITMVTFVLLFIFVPREVETGYVQIAESITSKTAKKLQKKHQMNLIGTGGGMMHQINMMAMSFQLLRPLEMDGARKIVVSCVEEYLHDINTNEEVRPFLAKYPFPAENVEIRVFSAKPNGTRYYDPLICVVSVTRGEVAYRTRGIDSEFGYQSEIFEPYEQALEIVKREAPDVLPSGDL